MQHPSFREFLIMIGIIGFAIGFWLMFAMTATGFVSTLQ